jgi:glycosyltransferase involved in cell wall biosynthesis
MVAFHFPPLAGSSGIQRTLRLVQHLPALGWEPLVLTIDPRAYERTSTDLNAEVPPGTVVRRAWGLDTARHLAWRGRYWAALARPDRWVSWRWHGVRVGLEMIKTYRPDALWSTYPLATAHLIGTALHKKSGLPWVADFRDPMAQEGYPADPLTWKQFAEIEKNAVTQAALSVFTTPSAAAQYRQRYPAQASRIRVLENGYDEHSFAQVEAPSSTRAALNAGALTLLHSGIVYPQERDPTQLIQALRKMHDAGQLVPGTFKIRFRAAVQEAMLQQLAVQHGVQDYVQVAPPVDYQAALREMLDADGLLVMQAANCNAQIPAKVYEYLRSRRPVLCLSDPEGDTVAVLREAGLQNFARLDSVDDICTALAVFLDQLRQRTCTLPSTTYVEQASRAGRAQLLVQWLNEMVC